MILDLEYPTTELSFNTEFGETYRLGSDDLVYILETEDGYELPAVLVEDATVFDATANDIRLGKTAATESGITLGEKVIPSYYTTESIQVVKAGKEVEISILKERELYKYTKLQAMLCEFNKNSNNSVAVMKVAINDNVYDVQSTTPLVTITTNDVDKTIKFGITNDTSKPMVLRFFTYKEIY